MSYPTSPYLLYGNQHTVNREPFNRIALTKRFGYYAPEAQYQCPVEPVNAANAPLVVSAPCCPELAGQDVLGIGHNNGILEYQFGSSMNVPFCGVPMDSACPNQCAYGLPTPTNCEKCPCRIPGCGGGAAGGCCDYGFARNHGAVFGPNGGNRNGNLKWGG